VAVAAVLIAAAWTDVRQGKIPNAVTYAGVLMGLAGHTVTGGLGGDGPLRIGLGGAAVGLAAGFLPLLVAWQAGGVGGGDAKLMAAVGALTGWQFTLAAMAYGLAIAALMALAVIVARRVAMRTLARIGRSVFLFFMKAGKHDPATPESPKIPLGLALCIGSGLALLEAIVRGPVARKLMMFW
jgi:prepilin peptidase CpaA